MTDSTKIIVSFGALRAFCKSPLVLTTNAAPPCWDGTPSAGRRRPEVVAFDGVSAVVDQKDHRLVVVSQNGRQLLRRDLERTVAHEQQVTAIGRRGQGNLEGRLTVDTKPPPKAPLGRQGADAAPTRSTPAGARSFCRRTASAGGWPAHSGSARASPYVRPRLWGRQRCLHRLPDPSPAAVPCG
jgi:hypothetical protein